MKKSIFLVITVLMLSVSFSTLVSAAEPSTSSEKVISVLESQVANQNVTLVEIEGQRYLKIETPVSIRYTDVTTGRIVKVISKRNPKAKVRR